MMTVGMAYENLTALIYTNFTELFNVKTGQKCRLQNLPFYYIHDVAPLFYEGMPVVCGGQVSFGYIFNFGYAAESNPRCLVFQQGSWNQVRQAIRIICHEE